MSSKTRQTEYFFNNFETNKYVTKKSEITKWKIVLKTWILCTFSEVSFVYINDNYVLTQKLDKKYADLCLVLGILETSELQSLDKYSITNCSARKKDSCREVRPKKVTDLFHPSQLTNICILAPYRCFF